MGKVIAISNLKGGVGKTTTCHNLGWGLATEYDKRVCLIDLNPQADLTKILGYNPADLDVTVEHALRGIFENNLAPIEDYLIHACEMDILPADGCLAPFGDELSSGRYWMVESVLQRLIEKLNDHYDYILIDCVNYFGKLLHIALCAADEVLLVAQPNYFGVDAIAEMLNIVEIVQQRLNQSLSINGILLTQANMRTLHAREAVTRLRSDLDGRVYHSIIPYSVQVSVYQEMHLPIFTLKNNPVAKAYHSFLEEFMEREDQKI